MKKYILFAILTIAVIIGVGTWGILSIVNSNDKKPETEKPVQVTNNIKHSIDLDEIVSGGPPKDGIPSINNPKFESVTAADTYLNDELLGVGIVNGGVERFYPFQILVWHELVNDTINDTPILVSYCPLCGTAIVYDRRVDGETLEFGVSGKLYRSDLLMFDRATDSYWAQVTGEAVVGPHTGSVLDLYPIFENARWGDWKTQHPNGEVLSRDTGSNRDYTRTPYEGYEDSPHVWFPVGNEDDRLPPKTWVSGVTIGDNAKAYPIEKITEQKLVNDILGDTELLVVKDPKNGIKMFERRIQTASGTQQLTFEINETGELRDTGTSSTWSFNGEAIRGELQGTQLVRWPSIPSFWFAWAAFYPDTFLFE